jgi:NAD-dependent deacetylase
MRDISNIVMLTGAGISAESGLATFRGRTGSGKATASRMSRRRKRFGRDPALVQAFYDARRAKLREVEPNAAHRALARLDAEWPGELLIVTQNVDDLHERAGAKRLLHMHGELRSAWCLACDARLRWEADLGDGPPCPSCGAAGRLRPDIVWFGEMPYGMDRIDRALMEADLFVSIGTSGNVYPAAGFVQTARHVGARTLEMNLEPSMGSFLFDESRPGPPERSSPPGSRRCWRAAEPSLHPVEPDLAVEAAVFLPARIDLHVEEEVTLRPRSFASSSRALAPISLIRRRPCRGRSLSACRGRRGSAGGSRPIRPCAPRTAPFRPALA